MCPEWSSDKTLLLETHAASLFFKSNFFMLRAWTSIYRYGIGVKVEISKSQQKKPKLHSLDSTFVIWVNPKNLTTEMYHPSLSISLFKNDSFGHTASCMT